MKSGQPRPLYSINARAVIQIGKAWIALIT